MNRRSSSKLAHFASCKPLVAAVILVLLMTVVIYPEAVVGLVLRGGASGSVSGFDMGVPVYAGGYMDSALDRTEGVSLMVSFAGTNVSSIQADNYLTAGIGVHSPGCCVDGIDYGYGFDVYLLRNGSEVFVASAWEVCDYVSACGDHSWKVLMFLNSSVVGSADLSSEISLAMVWRGHTVYWVYAVGGAGPSINLTRFEAPPQENPCFDIGVLSGGGGEKRVLLLPVRNHERLPHWKGRMVGGFRVPCVPCRLGVEVRGPSAHPRGESVVLESALEVGRRLSQRRGHSDWGPRGGVLLFAFNDHDELCRASAEKTTDERQCAGVQSIGQMDNHL